jgi:hypothetical protein
MALCIRKVPSHKGDYQEDIVLIVDDHFRDLTKMIQWCVAKSLPILW